MKETVFVAWGALWFAMGYLTASIWAFRLTFRRPLDERHEYEDSTFPEPDPEPVRPYSHKDFVSAPIAGMPTHTQNGSSWSKASADKPLPPFMWVMWVEGVTPPNAKEIGHWSKVLADKPLPPLEWQDPVPELNEPVQQCHGRNCTKMEPGDAHSPECLADHEATWRGTAKDYQAGQIFVKDSQAGQTFVKDTLADLPRSEYHDQMRKFEKTYGSPEWRDGVR